LSQRVMALIPPPRPPRAPDHRPRAFPPSPGSPFVLNDYPAVTVADLRHAAAHEHPLTLVDLLFRRVGLGWCESQAREGARAAAESVADVLGWDDARMTREVAAYHAHLAHAHRLGTGG
ncbi:MAG: glycerol-3-phosphate dehydrogenase C-terminal domain-containing protein, partial [Alphaproteobacteria bacterium]